MSVDQLCIERTQSVWGLVGQPIGRTFNAGIGTSEIEQCAYDERPSVDSLLTAFPPVHLAGSVVQVDFERMEVGRPYPVAYKGKQRFFMRTAVGEVEVYIARR